MSTSAAAATSTLEDTRKRNPPLWHYYCKCQREAIDRRARCGALLAGIRASRSSVKPVDTCVICIDIEESKGVCKFCGREAGT